MFSYNTKFVKPLSLIWFYQQSKSSIADNDIFIWLNFSPWRFKYQFIKKVKSTLCIYTNCYTLGHLNPLHTDFYSDFLTKKLDRGCEVDKNEWKFNMDE